MTTELSPLTEHFLYGPHALTGVSQEGMEGIAGKGGRGAQAPEEGEAPVCPDYSL